MGLALLCLTFGGMLVYSSLKGQGILDVFAGEPAPEIVPQDYSDMDTVGVAPGVTGAAMFGAGDLGTMPSAGTVQYDGQPVAGWIVPILKWAKANGWSGSVTSGWRDPNRVITPSPGLPVAPQGQSNHNKSTYPGGAVDVSEPDELERVLKNYPGRLKIRRDPAIKDPIHFSVRGN